MDKNAVISSIEKNKIIMVFRGIAPDRLFPAADALCEAGITLAEVAFDASVVTPDSETAKTIAVLCEKYAGRLTVGAGSVMNEKQVELAAQAGANYIVSPNSDERVIAKTRELSLVSIPGAFTPTEICRAHSLGADFVKIFPAGSVGPEYFAAITAPLGNIKLLAVGGINSADIPQYLAAGVRGFGISTKILNRKLLDRGDYEAIKTLAREYIDAASGDTAVPIHSNAKMCDDRYNITCAERDKILSDVFISQNPLRLKVFSAKEKKKVVILTRIAAEFEVGRVYRECEVDEILGGIFEDYVTLRRYLIEYGFMVRSRDCSEYRRA